MDQLEEFLDGQGIGVRVTRVSKDGSPLFLPSYCSACYQASISCAAKEAVLYAYFNEDAHDEFSVLRWLLNYAQEVYGCPDFAWWMRNVEGVSRGLSGVVEDMSADDADAFRRAFYAFCKGIERALVGLLGEEVTDRLLAFV